MSTVKVKTEVVRKEGKKRSIVRETRGMWRNFLTEDGVNYVNRIRAEWTVRDKPLPKPR